MEEDEKRQNETNQLKEDKEGEESDMCVSLAVHEVLYCTDNERASMSDQRGSMVCFAFIVILLSHCLINA